LSGLWETFEESSPLKKEFSDPVFGICWKYIAYCPQCNIECSEAIEKRTVKKGKNFKIDADFTNCDCGFSCGCS
jgi:hypothetical protein